MNKDCNNSESIREAADRIYDEAKDAGASHKQAAARRYKYLIEQYYKDY